MALQDLLIALKKGTARSGDWAHRGRPGKVGGSGGGGGIAAGLRLDPKTAKLEDIRSRAAGESAKKRIPLGDRQELMKHYGKHLADCEYGTPCDSVVAYTGSSYRNINRHLRGKGDGYDKQQAEKYIPNIDKVIEEGPRTAKTMRVIRGVGSGSTAAEIAALAVGDEFQDKGYGSTSVKKDWDWSGDGTGSGLTLEVVVPKGSKGLYVEKISSHKSEQEFLLPRNTKYRIISKEINEQGGGKVVVEEAA